MAWRIWSRARIRSRSGGDAEAAGAEGGGRATAAAAAANIDDAGLGIVREGGEIEAFPTMTRDEAGDNLGVAEEATRAAADKMEMAGNGGGSSRVLDFDRDLGAAGMFSKTPAAGEAFPTEARDAERDRDAVAGTTGAARYEPLTPVETSATGA